MDISNLKRTWAGRQLSRARQLWRGAGILSYDVWRYMCWSASFRHDYSQASMDYELIISSHIIEKAYSLPDTKRSFGDAVVKDLCYLLAEHDKRRYSRDGLGYRMAVRALRYFREDRKKQDVDMGDLEPMIDALVETGFEEALTKPSALDDWKPWGFGGFAKTRATVRDYADKEVDISLIEEAIEIARHSPSACNRQPWKVHAYGGRQLKETLLKYQSGNRGFADRAPWILVVTTDLASTKGVTERYESFIDGGIFAMSLIYSLHDLGIGTCPLNWFSLGKNDRKVRRAIGLAQSETIIMYIAVGYPSPGLEVARSEKRRVEEILVTHG